MGIKKINVLFVCLGNICRSPAAESILIKHLKMRQIEDSFYVDSAGTSSLHKGELADERMRREAELMGVKISSRSRPVKIEDFEFFDYIVAMDKKNQKDLTLLCPTRRLQSKIHLMCDFRSQYSYSEVPDPYYGGPQGFRLVLEILDDSMEKFLNKILL